MFLSYKDARARMQELKDEIYENAQDLVYTICPVKNKDQPTWEEGARNLIFGLVLAFCEDCIKTWMIKSETCPLCRAQLEISNKNRTPDGIKGADRWSVFDSKVDQKQMDEFNEDIFLVQNLEKGTYIVYISFQLVLIV
mgnify:CR=1 FL=1